MPQSNGRGGSRRFERGEEVAELGVDVGGAGDGVGDLLAKEGAETMAQAVERDAQGGLRESQAGGELGVRRLGASAAGEGGQEQVEASGAFRRLFGAKAAGDGLQERQRPGAIKGAVGRGFGRRRKRGVVERRFEPDVATRGPGVVAQVGEVVVERREQPGPETDGTRSKGGEGFVAKEPGEEALHRIIRVRLKQSATQGVAEQRRPVGGAEIGQGAGADGACVRPRMAAGVEDERPAGGGERGGQKMVSGMKMVSWSWRTIIGADAEEIIFATL